MNWGFGLDKGVSCLSPLTLKLLSRQMHRIMHQGKPVSLACCKKSELAWA
jgi:hypothetical protein